LGIYAKMRVDKLASGEEIEEFKDNDDEESY
jgi:hypothetical protein